MTVKVNMQAQELLRVLIEAERTYKEAIDLVQSQGADLFKSIRGEYSLTQRQLADILHVDFSMISKIENNHMRPGKPMLRRLSAWLDAQHSDKVT